MTIQDVFEKLLKDITQHRALETITNAVGNESMANWHRGHIQQAENTAKTLALYFDCSVPELPKVTE